MPRRLWAACALAFALAGPAPAAEPEPSPAATAFVAGFADAHLSGMLSKIGGRQPTMHALAHLHGEVVAAVFDAEIDRAVQAHAAEWRRNMALAWTGLMSEDELTSLTVEGAASPHLAKYQALSPEAGQAMQALSQDLFRAILAEVIRNTIASLSETAPEEAPATE